MTSSITASTPDHLVIVACHAIFLGQPDSPDCDVYDAQQWHLQSFQKPTGTIPGEHETFLQHIYAGLSALAYGSISRSSVLVFSGAATALDVTGLTEAQSYFNAAVALTQRLGQGHPFAECFKSRTFLDENATDSYQNLLFSILKFRRHFGRYPRTVRVITHAFKTKRFLVSLCAYFDLWRCFLQVGRRHLDATGHILSNKHVAWPSPAELVDFPPAMIAPSLFVSSRLALVQTVWASTLNT